jgi:hypothetical protein
MANSWKPKAAEMLHACRDIGYISNRHLQLITSTTCQAWKAQTADQVWETKIRFPQTNLPGHEKGKRPVEGIIRPNCSLYSGHEFQWRSWRRWNTDILGWFSFTVILGDVGQWGWLNLKGLILTDRIMVVEWGGCVLRFKLLKNCIHGLL